MARIHRRKLLKLSGAGAIAAKTGGIAAILASGRAPAYAQGTTVHWLRWNDFVPTSDKVLREQIVPAAAKDLGITLNIEMINGNDIQARTTAAIQSGTGPDVICALNNWPQLYADSLADVERFLIWRNTDSVCVVKIICHFDPFLTAGSKIEDSPNHRGRNWWIGVRAEHRGIGPTVGSHHDVIYAAVEFLTVAVNVPSAQLLSRHIEFEDGAGIVATLLALGEDGLEELLDLLALEGGHRSGLRRRSRKALSRPARPVSCGKL